MITTAIINKLITGSIPATSDEERLLDEAVAAYPFCALLQHLQHDTSPFLNELYPANPVVRAAPELRALQTEAGNLQGQAAVPLTEAGITSGGNLPGTAGQPEEAVAPAEDEPLIRPLSSEDYFLQQGVKVSADIPELEEIIPGAGAPSTADEEQSLLVMMSFAEWLTYLKHKTQKEKEDEEEQRALKSSWRRQKLAAAIEEENEEIPDQVFEMAVNSISPGENVATEALAEVYARQGKKEKAIEMYRKLSLLKPEKSVYFAHKIENLQKEL